MLTKKDQFLDLLFDKDQYTCFSESANGYKVTYFPTSKDTFFCINALDPNVDHKPEREWHRPDLPRRADHNVVCYRNLLIELDNMPLEEQVEYVTSKVPVSSIVYSGGKSMHFIISLEEPVNKEQYRELFLRLQVLLPKLDRSCKNPSRLSRLPEVMRQDTGKVQTLVHIGTRIALQTLEDVLPLLEKRTYLNNTAKNKNFISSDIVYYATNPQEVMNEYNFGRNAYFHFLGQRISDAGLDDSDRLRYVDTAYSNLNDITDFPLDEAYSAARIK